MEAQHSIHIKYILRGYLHDINIQECWQTSKLLRFGFINNIIWIIEHKLFWGRDLLFCVCISHGVSDLASKSKLPILF